MLEIEEALGLRSSPMTFQGIASRNNMFKNTKFKIYPNFNIVTADTATNYIAVISTQPMIDCVSN
jgi:hypothetical protein